MSVKVTMIVVITLKNYNDKGNNLEERCMSDEG